MRCLSSVRGTSSCRLETPPGQDEAESPFTGQSTAAPSQLTWQQQHFYFHVLCVDQQTVRRPGPLLWTGESATYQAQEAGHRLHGQQRRWAARLAGQSHALCYKRCADPILISDISLISANLYIKSSAFCSSTSALCRKVLVNLYKFK